MSVAATSGRLAPDRALSTAGSLSRTALLVGLVAGVTVPEQLATAGPALLVAAAVLGLPHGAVDHLAWGWGRGETRPHAGTVLAYAAAAGAAVSLALLHPAPALLALLVLSVLHFAEGEVAWARLRGEPGLWRAGAASGLAVVSLPVLLRPEGSRPLLAALDPQLPSLLLDPRVRGPVLALTALVVLAGVWAARGSPERLGEVLLVTAVAVVLPPLAAFATWFAGWHALRHTARLLRLDPRAAHDASAGPGLRRLARAAALPSGIALVGTGFIVATVGATGGLIIALLALTVPHTAVVARLASSAAPRLSRTGG